jgi:hypothetical protein
MADIVKFNTFTDDLLAGVHQVGTHVFKGYLSNELPLATDTVKANIADITAGAGYAGPVTLTVTKSTSGGVAKLLIADVTITCDPDSNDVTIGPYAYFIVYNDTAASDRLMMYLALGANTLTDGQAQVINFDGAAGVLTV